MVLYLYVTLFITDKVIFILISRLLGFFYIALFSLFEVTTEEGLRNQIDTFLMPELLH